MTVWFIEGSLEAWFAGEPSCKTRGGQFKYSGLASTIENTKAAKFVGPPGKETKVYTNRLKVEETFSRYKRIIGNKFKAFNISAQINKAKISLFILNKMRDLGMPLTVRLA